MTHSALVYVLNPSNDLLIDTNSSFLMKSLVLYDVVKKFPIAAILHNKVKFGLCLDDL